MCRQTERASEDHSSKVLRKILGLRWEPNHGLLGLCCWCCQIAALVAPEGSQQQAALVFAVICSTTVLSFGSRHLLEQAPRETVIMPGVVAPHRDAFQRTSALVIYLNLRLTWQCNWWPFGTSSYALAMCAYNLYCFLPRKGFTNGNTFIFVVPMWLGISVDTAQQVLDPNGAFNATVATVPHLLLTQLIALAVAFIFTLAFRRVVPIVPVYFGAAVVMHTLVAGGMWLHLRPSG